MNYNDQLLREATWVEMSRQEGDPIQWVLKLENDVDIWITEYTRGQQVNVDTILNIGPEYWFADNFNIKEYLVSNKNITIYEAMNVIRENNTDYFNLEN